MKSRGPKQSRSSVYAELAAEAIANPNEWYEQAIIGTPSTNAFTYVLASQLCEMKIRDRVLYVRYHGPAK